MNVANNYNENFRTSYYTLSRIVTTKHSWGYSALKHDELGTEVIRWYFESLGGTAGRARATRAKLRRCTTCTDALVVSETHQLNRRLHRIGANPSAGQLTVIAVMFANITEIDGKKIAVQFGSTLSNNSDHPSRKLSEIRFQSLIRIHTREKLMLPLRRAVSVLGNRIACDGRQLAEDLFYWNDQVRNEWCFQYFGDEDTSKTRDEET